MRGASNLNVGAIENPSNPSTFRQSPMLADCETSRLRDRAILVPATVIGEGKATRRGRQEAIKSRTQRTFLIHRTKSDANELTLSEAHGCAGVNILGE